MFLKVDKIQNIEIRKAVLSDSRNISKLHLETYHSDHFTSHFPMYLLEEYFKALIQNTDYSYVCYDTIENILMGFVIAGENTSRVVNQFTKSNSLRLLLVLLKNPKFIIEKIFDLYKRFLPQKVSQANLRVQVYVTNPNFQRKGVGMSLMNKLEKELKQQGHKLYGLSVRKNNIEAIHFYEKNHFKVEYESKKSIYLIKYLI
jgi:ribosomal protein S18 acetylase RimI-like enzyme